MNTITLNDKTYTLSDEVADRIKAELETQEAKPKRWRAAKEKTRWLLDDQGRTSLSYGHTTTIDQYRYDIGNYFQTRQEAEAYRDRLLAEQVIRDSSDFVPDWSDHNQDKHYVAFDYTINQLCTLSRFYTQQLALAFYRTREEAEAAIADPKVRKAYLTVFGVKDAV